MLTARRVACVRDQRVLFADLSFEIEPGELVQVEGPNGSGKTSLLRILTGLLQQDEGEVLWQGTSITECRDTFHRDLLFIGHQTGIKRELTVVENLRFYAALHHPLVDTPLLLNAINKVGLGGYEDVAANNLSAGQQRRIALARLWMSQHKIWILDEPLTAIDKRGIAILEALFLSHIKQGGIVILTSHQDMFVDQSCLRRITLGGQH
ncbi:cytochrome c biogenesis heme-transporting ATPase CcmA [Thaumasiovibrio sp. DFM-14]|uniref:cytochrome c biogenesis heme-transporting ATPase CcmA n=1 Tax=Thaumasiovibrio sp. DFM-14 TaxID=3384792 RepID=UPI0039A0AD7A